MARGLSGALAGALLLLSCSFAGEPSLPPAATLAAQRAEYEADAPKTILELQPFRSATRAAVTRADGTPGTATLTNLNPYANSWYLLSIGWPAAAGGSASYHLQNPYPLLQVLRLRAADPRSVTVANDSGVLCTLWSSDGRGALAAAVASGLPYAPLCGGALYLRNPVAGHHTSLERITDFLRDHVWGGDRVVNFVKQEFYRDAFLEKGAVGSAAAPAPVARGPMPAELAPEYAGGATVTEHLAIDLGSAARELQLGQWYAVPGLSGVFVSAIAPRYIAPRLLAHEAHVNALDPVESGALAYLVAFDPQLLELHFVLGTDHPRLDWSERPPPASQDPRLPGPDGVGSAAPLVTNGMVNPADAPRTVATFTGGFKRAHGAFRVGALAERNHGSHYGFIEQGVIFSKLQPGLSTVLVTDDGAADLRTWSAADDVLLPRLRDVRQNGVPLIEYEAQQQRAVPGELVDRWGPGNWSGSAEEVLRTLRAGLCLQQQGRQRYLIYGYFSAATPSAMTRVFQAYQCRYAMLLDINALEHTYLALYVSRGGRRLVEHLVEGMEEVDRTAGKEFAPRFLAFPDDRDFFYLTRRAAEP
ncbi:MAG TPA: hypothetical protein VGR86_04520 [Steroidobacteraceae bacterium]|nr:hypothetical protein [Steroidobacteraceae bacterium]